MIYLICLVYETFPLAPLPVLNPSRTAVSFRGQTDQILFRGTIVNRTKYCW